MEASTSPRTASKKIGLALAAFEANIDKNNSIGETRSGLYLTNFGGSPKRNGYASNVLLGPQTSPGSWSSPTSSKQTLLKHIAAPDLSLASPRKKEAVETENRLGKKEKSSDRAGFEVKNTDPSVRVARECGYVSSDDDLSVIVPLADDLSMDSSYAAGAAFTSQTNNNYPPTHFAMRPGTIRGYSFDSDDVDSSQRELSHKSSGGFSMFPGRPSTVRGNSFNSSDSEDLSEDEVQRPNRRAPRRGTRPIKSKGCEKEAREYPHIQSTQNPELHTASPESKSRLVYCPPHQEGGYTEELMHQPLSLQSTPEPPKNKNGIAVVPDKLVASPKDFNSERANSPCARTGRIVVWPPRREDKDSITNARSFIPVVEDPNMAAVPLSPPTTPVLVSSVTLQGRSLRPSAVRGNSFDGMDLEEEEAHAEKRATLRRVVKNSDETRAQDDSCTQLIPSPANEPDTIASKGDQRVDNEVSPVLATDSERSWTAKQSQAHPSSRKPEAFHEDVLSNFADQRRAMLARNPRKPIAAVSPTKLKDRMKAFQFQQSSVSLSTPDLESTRSPNSSQARRVVTNKPGAVPATPTVLEFNEPCVTNFTSPVSVASPITSVDGTASFSSGGDRASPRYTTRDFSNSPTRSSTLHCSPTYPTFEKYRLLPTYEEQHEALLARSPRKEINIDSPTKLKERMTAFQGGGPPSLAGEIGRAHV